VLHLGQTETPKDVGPVSNRTLEFVLAQPPNGAQLCVESRQAC
jgi:hypothetical protein